ITVAALFSAINCSSLDHRSTASCADASRPRPERAGTACCATHHFSHVSRNLATMALVLVTP
ncbi:MAG: hypothetical protein WA879_00030, partial [Candidatus Acidiferrales bacterium]